MSYCRPISPCVKHVSIFIKVIVLLVGIHQYCIDSSCYNTTRHSFHGYPIQQWARAVLS